MFIIHSSPDLSSYYYKQKLLLIITYSQLSFFKTIVFLSFMAMQFTASCSCSNKVYTLRKGNIALVVNIWCYVDCGKTMAYPNATLRNAFHTNCTQYLSRSHIIRTLYEMTWQNVNPLVKQQVKCVYSRNIITTCGRVGLANGLTWHIESNPTTDL